MALARCCPPLALPGVDADRAAPLPPGARTVALARGLSTRIPPPMGDLARPAPPPCPGPRDVAIVPVEMCARRVGQSLRTLALPAAVEMVSQSVFERAQFPLVDLKGGLPRFAMRHPLAGRRLLPAPMAAILGVSDDW
jgi:hypothetical protein